MENAKGSFVQRNVDTIQMIFANNSKLEENVPELSKFKKSVSEFEQFVSKCDKSVSEI